LRVQRGGDMSKIYSDSKVIISTMGMFFVFIFFVFSCTQQIKREAQPVEEKATESIVRAYEVSGTEINEITRKIIEGGKLYDKWWIEVSGVEEPKTNHPMWSLQTTNKRAGGATWRCKECHGWDYMGKDGAYSSGSHRTNFPGVFKVRNMSVKDIESFLLGATNSNHNYSYVLDYDSINKLALFLREGLVDMRNYINYEDKSPFRANPEHGKVLFEKECVKCHGEDGTLMNFGDDVRPEFIGTVAFRNPWEFIHKVRFGQPGTIMPALRIKLKLTEEDKKMPSGIETGYSMDDVIDIMEYSRTLPKFYKID
jgi:thiosulfate dehydrogenase